jgi:hypothetical protein
LRFAGAQFALAPPPLLLLCAVDTLLTSGVADLS